MKKKFWHDGVKFSCQQCGNCCTLPGGSVTASEEDFRKIANFLNITFDEFLANFTFNHNGLVSIKSVPDGPCIFYKNGCSVYEVRPTQCRTFPFWPDIMKSKSRLKFVQLICAGINTGQLWSKDEISKELKKHKIDLMVWPENE